MPDLRIQFTEEMVGAGHPVKADTLNRLALVEHNEDGTHRYSAALDVREFLPFGYATDASVDYSPQFNEAIEELRDRSLGSGGVLRVPLGRWNIGTGAAGLTLYEGICITGAARPEYTGGAMAGGTWLVYSGTGDAVRIDGEWTGFDSRREIQIERLGIRTTGSNAAISADFLTQFRFKDINIKGSAAYGIYGLNSYNGILSRVKIDGPANPFYLSIKPSPNDVFSGQMLFEGCDFWNGSGKGAHLAASNNVLAQMVFLKCHFKSNAYGAYMEGGNVHKVNFLGCHFEGNTAADLYVHSTVSRGPVVKGCHFNNANPVWKIDCQGGTASIEDNEFVGSGTGKGVRINGADNYVARNYFYGNLNNGAMLLDASADGTAVGKNVFSNATGRIVDNGVNTAYEGELIAESKAFTLSAAAETEVRFRTNKDFWIREARIIYPEATSGDAGVAVRMGNPSSPGAYIDHISDQGQASCSSTEPVIAAAFIPAGTVITFGCAGGKQGGGTAKVTALLVPFENR